MKTCASFFLVATFCIIGMQGFAQFSLPVEVARNEPGAFTVADLDGDGWMDLAGGASWRRNLGDGTFEPPQALIPPPEGSVHEAVLDVNADGQPDIIMALEDGVIWAYLNEGGGTFSQTGQQIAYFFDQTQNTIEEPPAQIDLVDINNDGDKDLLISFDYSIGIWCFDNNGANVYGPRRTLAGSLIYIVDYSATDLNGDGFADLVYALDNTGFDRMEVKLNLGTGSFGPAMAITGEQGQSQRFEVRDLTSDGIPDLILTKYTAGQLVLMPGNGDGSFGTEQVLVADIPSTEHFALVDMNSDGVEDALMGSPADSVIVYYPGLGGTAFGAQVVVTANAEDLFYMVPFDMDNDGATDVMAQGYMLVTHHNNSAGTVWEEAFHNMRVGYTDMRLADMDQDGDEDLVMAYGGTNGCIAWHPREGGTFLRPRVVVSDLADVEVVRAADLNGDGLQDLIFQTAADVFLRWSRALGAGVFDEPVEITSPFDITNFDVGDLDNDGDIDVLYYAQSFSSSPLRAVAAVNEGDATFNLQYAAGLPDSWDIRELRDMDGDGLLDMVSGGTDVRWHRNNGDLTFTPMPIMPDVGVGNRMDFMDVDGDGLVDVVLSGVPGFNWYRNLGGGNYAAVQPLLGISGWMMEHADVDGDGLDDILTDMTVDGMYWFRNLGGSIDPIPNLIITNGDYHFNGYSPPRYDEVLIADYDGNGLSDFMFYYLPDTVNYRTVIVYNHSGETALSGRCYVDMDADGSYSSGDVPAPWLPVAVDPTPSVPHSAPNGLYQYQAGAGNYDLSLGDDFPTPLWNVSVGDGGYAVQVDDAPITDLDFALSPAMDASQIEVSVVMGTAPCGTSNTLWVSYRNTGTRVEQGRVSLVLDSLFGYVASDAAPLSVIGDSITWEFDSLGFFAMRTIALEVLMPGVEALGLPYTLTGAVVALDDQGVPTAQFNAELSDTVSCAYDPNDKRVEPEGFGAYGAIDVGTDGLTYTIRFQNTGTAPAENVVLRDALPALVDPQRLHVLAWSHAPTSFEVNALNELIIRFEGIQLPDSGTSLAASQGFIRFGTRLTGGAHLDVVENTAGIYFDANPPIITNTTLNTLVDCALWVPEATQDQSGYITASAGLGYQWYLDGLELPGDTGQTLAITDFGNYHAVVTSVHGCVATTEVVQVIALGVDAHGPAFATVYPDPFTDSFRIRLAEGGSIQEMALLDRSGRMVRRMKGGASELVIERGDLPSGFYFLRVVSTSGEVGVFRVAAE